MNGYYADGMRDLPGGQAACDLGCLRLGMAGDVGRRSGRQTHDLIVGRLYRASERICHAKVADEAGGA
ncbi:hypothetical protein ACLB1E_35395 [Escherichia coli]